MLSSTASTFTRKVISSSLLLSITMKIGLQGENITTSIHIFTVFFFVWMPYHIKLSVIFMAYSLICSKQTIAITMLVWVQLHEEIWLPDKILHLVNRRKKNFPFSQQHIFTMTYQVKMCRWEIIWLAAVLRVLKPVRAAKLKPLWLTL